eukprot:gnl/Trimastix_PCT/2794.p1 GENE.gnl/Trimastix_PCT/2794~~gnl/Trimastix_PCT/2794.p1  ORF type:complete len:205 (-),score=41.46 gnl/Trimastix_PCT/2794:80-664(-)
MEGLLDSVNSTPVALDPSKLQQAEQEKEQGNQFFRAKEWKRAAFAYLQALACIRTGRTNPEVPQEVKDLKIRLHSNLAACYLALKNYARCIENAEEVLRLEPNNVKAIYRKGSAYLEMNELDRARTELRRAIEMSPRSQEIRRKYDAIAVRERELHAKQRQQFAGMFSRGSLYEDKASNASKEKDERDDDENDD